MAVLEPPLVSLNRAKTCNLILVAGSEMVKRLESSAGVPDPSGAAHEHPNPFAVVGAGYGAVRVGTHRLRHQHKPKAEQPASPKD